MRKKRTFFWNPRYVNDGVNESDQEESDPQDPAQQMIPPGQGQQYLPHSLVQHHPYGSPPQHQVPPTYIPPSQHPSAPLPPYVSQQQLASYMGSPPPPIGSPQHQIPPQPQQPYGTYPQPYSGPQHQPPYNCPRQLLPPMPRLRRPTCPSSYKPIYRRPLSPQQQPYEAQMTFIPEDVPPPRPIVQYSPPYRVKQEWEPAEVSPFYLTSIEEPQDKGPQFDIADEEPQDFAVTHPNKVGNIVPDENQSKKKQRRKGRTDDVELKNKATANEQEPKASQRTESQKKVSVKSATLVDDDKKQKDVEHDVRKSREKRSKGRKTKDVEKKPKDNRKTKDVDKKAKNPRKTKDVEKKPKPKGEGQDEPKKSK